MFVQRSNLKTTLMKTKKLILGMALALLIVSCNKDENNDNTAAFTSDEAKINSKIDVANDDVSDIVEGQFNATIQDDVAGRPSELGNNATLLSACATVTRIPAFGTALTAGTQVTKTIDFGTEGCALNNGNVLKGKIVITFTYDPQATTHTINYEFVDFYHNAIKFAGNKSFTRTMSAGENAHPTVVMNMEMSATFPDGRVFYRVGTRTREFIEGFNTPFNFTNDVHKVTGNWTTTFPNTTVQTSTITTPIIVKMSCVLINKPVLVQGIITFERNGNTATLDYGDGTCDNLAVFTANGNSYNIILGGN